MEFFEAIKTFITAVRSELSGFKEVAGTKISDEYFAYKDSVRSESWWYVIDKPSGLAISPKLKTLKDCKDWYANLTDEQLTKIEQAKLSDKYKEQCVKLAAWKPVQTEELDFDGAFAALNELYEDLDQEILEWN